MIEEIQKLSLKMYELIKVLTPPNLISDLAFWSNIVLIITLFVLIWYTIETHQIANQTKESNLRQVILRAGFIKNWDSIKAAPKDNKVDSKDLLQFRILKNIATSIQGYIIINGLKFELLFGHNISRIEETKFQFEPNWGWATVDTVLAATFKEEGKSTKKPNQIVMSYKDIEGNKYHTIETENFDQKCFRGKCK